MVSVMKMLLKWEVGGSALNNLGNYIVDGEKSWNCVFEFLCKKAIPNGFSIRCESYIKF